MSEKRRNILKGLASGPVWSTPVVSSILIPAHASTTCIDGDCCLPAGCYQFESGNYTAWPGGSGPHQNVPGGHQNSDCSDPILPQESWTALVIASSESNAQTAFEDLFNGDICSAQLLPIQPAELPDGCQIYGCFN